jgi:hypothetical protein
MTQVNTSRRMSHFHFLRGEAHQAAVPWEKCQDEDGQEAVTRKAAENQGRAFTGVSEGKARQDRGNSLVLAGLSNLCRLSVLGVISKYLVPDTGII